LRLLPRTIVLRRLAEISSIIGTPLPGATTVRFAYVRCDDSRGEGRNRLPD
jgi:hypothetical protein